MFQAKYQPKHLPQRPKRSFTKRTYPLRTAVIGGLLLSLAMMFTPAYGLSNLSQRMSTMLTVTDWLGATKTTELQTSGRADVKQVKKKEQVKKTQAKRPEKPQASPVVKPSPDTGAQVKQANEALAEAMKQVPSTVVPVLEKVPNEVASNLSGLSGRIAAKVADALSKKTSPPPPTTCAKPYGDGPSTMTVINHEVSFDVYWVGFDCKEVFYQHVSPGETYTESTYIGHVWRIRHSPHEKNQSTALIREFTITDSTQVELFGPAEYEIPPPPPPPPARENLESEGIQPGTTPPGR